MHARVGISRPAPDGRAGRSTADRVIALLGAAGMALLVWGTGAAPGSAAQITHAPKTYVAWSAVTPSPSWTRRATRSSKPFPFRRGRKASWPRPTARASTLPAPAHPARQQLQSDL